MPRLEFPCWPLWRAASLACLLAAAGGCAEAPKAADGGASIDPVDSRAYRAAWVRVMEAYGKGRYDKAANLLEKLPAGDSLASVYRSSLSASARLRAGDIAGADKAIAAALSVPFVAADSVWSGHFFRMRLRTLSALPPAARRDYLRDALKSPISAADRAAALYRLLDADTALVGRVERLDCLRRLVVAAPVDARLDSARRRALPVFAADTSREAQSLLLDLEERLSLWDEAIARGEGLASRTADTAAFRALQSRIALWYYNKGAYSESIKRYEGLLFRFGESPEAMIQIARAYRALGRTEASRDAYSGLVARFPKDARAAEVLWMRAYDDETSGRTDSALAGYDRIVREFPQHARAGEAMFRAGLVRLRRGDFEGARAAFADLRAVRKSGNLTGAARYWEGKALAARGDLGDTAQAVAAREAWAGLVRDHPFGHYGHLAREELLKRAALPDSLAWGLLLNQADSATVSQWLDAAAPSGVSRLSDGFGQSRFLPVQSLFDLGLDTLAVLTLQARANAASGELRPWYDAALRCRAAGFDYEAYRFGRRLADRLPVERWPSAPVAVLRLFYPPSYDDLIRPAAERHGVPARLASALIKQESGFDPNAVSRAGARGLMQLMPVTGAEQARKEGMPGFHPDSLFVPAVNVRLGVAYLGEVLKRHDGDVLLALAHYNAGPAALERWMPRLQGHPPEDVAEDIGYAETREYVKRVNANWKTYRVLWGDTSRASEGAR